MSTGIIGHNKPTLQAVILSFEGSLIGGNWEGYERMHIMLIFRLHIGRADQSRLYLVRIVRGLYFNKYKERMPEYSIYKVKAHPKLVPQPSETFPIEEGLKMRPFFVYGVVKDENKKNRNTWVLIFYDHLIFTVSVDYPN